MMRKHIMLDRKKKPVKAIRNNTKPNNRMVSKDREQLVVLTMDNHLTSVITEIGNELSTEMSWVVITNFRGIRLG